METKIIMRYKREKSAWICWNCEMENEISRQECYFCRAKRDNARVVKSWAEEAAFGMYEEKPAEKNNEDKIAGDGIKDVSEKTTREKEAVAEVSTEKDSVIGPVLIWSLLLIVIVLIIAVAR